MRKIFLIVLFTVIVSCKSDKNTQQDFSAKSSETEINPQLELGKKLFEGKGTCIACHKPTKKIIGPSIVEIAKIYKEQNADMVAFLKEQSKPIVDPSQYEVMKTNFSITKTMTNEELEAIESYMYSFLE